MVTPISATTTATILVAFATTGAAGPLILENQKLALRFDSSTGAWIGWVDKQSGQELVVAPAASAPEGLVTPQLDANALDAAVKAGHAISLEGTWRFAPEPEKTDADITAAPEFNDQAWETTPVPSRDDTGDRRLRDRVGTFWYRTTVTPPATWQNHDLALVIGAVDDFDTTYFNGMQIGAVGQETPHHWETPRHYTVPASLVQPGHPNTVAIRVHNGAFSGGITGPVRLGPAADMPTPAAASVIDHQASDNPPTLTLTMRLDPFRVQTTYTLEPGPWAISRRFKIQNTSANPQVVRAIACHLPSLCPGPRTAAIVPDSLPVGDQPIQTLDTGQVIRPSSQDGLVYLWSPAAAHGWGTWFCSENEYAPATIAPAGNGARVSHSPGTLARLAPKEQLQLGTQYAWLTHGSRDDVLHSVQAIFRIVHLQAPNHGIEQLRERILYCGHPGGMPEQGYRGFGGFKALQAYVPTLQKMGVDLLWLLPIFEHGDGQKWNLYSPFDHFQISPLYGTPQELKQLSATARSAGIDLMFDLVPHGPPDHTPLAKTHPEWVCLDEAGKPTYVWGQLAFDNANPAWQEYMRKAAEHHAREFGAVGARVDVAAGSPPNWDPKTGYRPSHSTLGGGLGMDRAIREGFLRVHGKALLLPEEYTGARIFYRDADLTYDAQLFFLFVDLHARKAPPREWVASLRNFLHDQALTLPPGAVKMRWTANHDTVSWTFQKKRTREVYGLERARSLLALCCLIDGVPMIYQGEENPTLYGGKGESIVDYLGKLIACRKRLPAISRGPADYHAVHAGDTVFACLRGQGGDCAIILVSLDPAPTTSTLTLPPALAATTAWQDELTGETIPATSVRMAGHQVRVLTPRR
ncbi:MAG: beta galactosidase jelly roll domain-containing protein [Phycisphaerae bacterium]|nr:beta galactosidase jelly roll domain-containing protein [Phycisphaerae bacterium]